MAVTVALAMVAMVVQAVIALPVRVVMLVMEVVVLHLQASFQVALVEVADQVLTVPVVRVVTVVMLRDLFSLRQ